MLHFKALSGITLYKFLKEMYQYKLWVEMLFLEVIVLCITSV